ncbi:MAG: low molecular weight phosphotyrosine protein phosphatase [Gemmatimonadota bacterium]|nr:low molecular weight phosphotyrosine protein phosphatase [Gemmatimonadota bacterium]MDE2873040.1 low molecular weight phosphotyrosine protein phosphatase [Gemmatimonadota bacterium]
MSGTSVSVLFVCLGNICRSPLAEGIFAALARERGLDGQFHADSAGTAGYHSGEPPDSRSTAVAAAQGIRLTGFARQVTPRDLERFDIVVAMDRSNRRSLERLRRRLRSGRGTVADIVMMRDYEPGARDPDVPDPYYGGPGGFERVYRILERACNGLLDELAGGDRD